MFVFSPECLQLLSIPVVQGVEAAAAFHVVGELVGKGDAQLILPNFLVPVLLGGKGREGALVEVDVCAQDIVAKLT